MKPYKMKYKFKNSSHVRTPLNKMFSHLFRLQGSFHLTASLTRSKAQSWPHPNKWAHLPSVQYVHSKLILPSEWLYRVINYKTGSKNSYYSVTCSDYRPISVTLILSQLLEKILVSTYFYPIIDLNQCRHEFADQFALRTTGSPTAALIQILSQVSELLLTHPYIHIISLDVLKAFDTVRHFPFIETIKEFQLPNKNSNWVIIIFSNEYD